MMGRVAGSDIGARAAKLNRSGGSMATRRCYPAVGFLFVAMVALIAARPAMPDTDACALFPKVHARKSISVAPERHKEFIAFVEMSMLKGGYHRSSVQRDTPDGHYDMIFQSLDNRNRVVIIVEHNNSSRLFVARIQSCNRRDIWRPDWRAFLSVVESFSSTEG